LLFSTRETVPTETSASWATWRMVTNGRSLSQVFTKHVPERVYNISHNVPVVKHF